MLGRKVVRLAGKDAGLAGDTGSNPVQPIALLWGTFERIPSQAHGKPLRL